jgi:hypothetical protein
MNEVVELAMKVLENAASTDEAKELARQILRVHPRTWDHEVTFPSMTPDFYYTTTTPKRMRNPFKDVEIT